MKKNILIAVVILILLGAGYIYRQSEQRPDTTIITIQDDSTQVVDESMQSETNTMDTEDIENTLEEQATINDGTYSTDDAQLMRSARGPANGHEGYVPVTTGSLQISDGIVTDGRFEVAMTGVRVTDIDNPGFESEIEQVFFDADNYPTATLDITSGTWMAGQSEMSVTGELTIAGQTQTITIPMLVQTDNNSVSIQSQFAIDRYDRGLDAWAGLVNRFINFEFDITLTIQ